MTMAIVTVMANIPKQINKMTQTTLTQGYLMLKINELEEMKAKFHLTPLEREAVDEKLKELRSQKEPDYLTKFKTAFLQRGLK